MCQNRTVNDWKARISELAALMDEFGLEEAELSGPGWSIEFSRRGPEAVPAPASVPAAASPEPVRKARRPKRPARDAAEAPAGTPITSPMMGIFYAASSPGAPPYVKEGDVVAVGQVVGLIEAMKVFNEITSPVAGTVKRIVAQNGQLVQPGEPLMYVG